MKISQQEVFNVLKRYTGQWMTYKEIAEVLKDQSKSSTTTTHNIKKMMHNHFFRDNIRLDTSQQPFRIRHVKI